MSKTLVIILGPHAVGKMTVGQALAEITVNAAATTPVANHSVTFENVTKTGKSNYYALIGSTNSYGKISNVHIKNMTILPKS